MKRSAQIKAYLPLLSEGVASARLEAQRLHTMLSEVMSSIQSSEHKEALYAEAGDVIQNFPTHLEALERHLDRTLYALSEVGQEEMRDHLTIEDRSRVDEAMKKVRSLNASASRVARSYLADLDPALGLGSGSCFVINRIENEVRQPREKERLIDQVESGESLSNPDASKVYDIEMESGVGRFKKLVLTAHAQYRMDLRGVSVPEVRAALSTFLKAWGDEKSRKSPIWQRWESDMARNETIEWKDTRLGVTVVFKVQGDGAVLVTTWTDRPDPKPTSRDRCET